MKYYAEEEKNGTLVEHGEFQVKRWLDYCETLATNSSVLSNYQCFAKTPHDYGRVHLAALNAMPLAWEYARFSGWGD